MNSSAENRANSQKKNGSPKVIFNLNTARQMLPLVRRIVDDVVQGRLTLARLQPEQDRLDHARRTLEWPERARRYQLHEETAGLEGQLRHALHELAELSVTLLDAGAERYAARRGSRPGRLPHVGERAPGLFLVAAERRRHPLLALRGRDRPPADSAQLEPG
jgi:hypothetical protein